MEITLLGVGHCTQPGKSTSQQSLTLCWDMRAFKRTRIEATKILDIALFALMVVTLAAQRLLHILKRSSFRSLRSASAVKIRHNKTPKYPVGRQKLHHKLL
jgi:hypothetical protein